MNNGNILEFNIQYSDLKTFMESNRRILVTEIISHIETVIYDDKFDEDNIFRINFKKKDTDIIPALIVDCKLDRKHIKDDLNDLMQWTLDEEEYELSHRIKILTDFLNEKDEVS